MVRASMPKRPLPSAPLRLYDVTLFYGGAAGGVRTYLEATMAYLAGEPVEHVVVVPGPRFQVERTGNSTLYRIPGPPIPFAPGYRFLLSLRPLAPVLAAAPPHVVEVGSPFLSVYSRFHRTVATSPSVIRDLRRLGLRNLELISLGVDLRVFRPRSEPSLLRQILSVAPEKPIAVFAGRFCPEKQLHLVLQAHARLEEETRPYLVLIGEGPSEKRLRKAAAGFADAAVLGPVRSRETLARMLSGADLYWAPGPAETFGLSVAEASASGLPVVGVRAGAVPDRVRGSKAAELYEVGDPDSAAAAVGLRQGLRHEAQPRGVREPTVVVWGPPREPLHLRIPSRPPPGPPRRRLGGPPLADPPPGTPGLEREPGSPASPPSPREQGARALPPPRVWGERWSPRSWPPSSPSSARSRRGSSSSGGVSPRSGWEQPWRGRGWSWTLGDRSLPGQFRPLPKRGAETARRAPPVVWGSRPARRRRRPDRRQGRGRGRRRVPRSGRFPGSGWPGP